MTRSFRSGGVAFPSPRGFAAVEIQPEGGRRRVFLVALGDAAAFPMMGGLSGLGGLVRRERNWLPELFGAMAGPVGLPTDLMEDAVDEEDEVYFGRLVEGEVVRDRAGRLFELQGESMRPLGRVARTPQGHLVELAPQGERFHPRRPRDYVDAIDAEVEPVEPAGPQADYSGIEAGAEQPAETSVSETPACRKLLAGAGPRRPVRYGEFRHLLASQLAHPERIRESHLLPCRVQVFEATYGMRQEEWTAAMEAEQVSGVQTLTAALAERLCLTHLLPPPRMRRPMRRAPGAVLPADRFLALHVEADPTADRTATAGATPEVSKAPAVTTAEAAPAFSGYPATARRTTIPENFLRAWEFVRSREEALYDLRIAAALRGPLQRLWQRLAGWFTGRAERRKWQALLCGKTLDEQLWSVRPPQGSLEHPRVRAWAEQMLVQAGYDAGAMLLEWQVFWRRKGV